jgi:hypothetical protein
MSAPALIPRMKQCPCTYPGSSCPTIYLPLDLSGTFNYGADLPFQVSDHHFEVIHRHFLVRHTGAAHRRGRAIKLVLHSSQSNPIRMECL